MILIRLTLFFACGIFLEHTFGATSLISLALFPVLALVLLLPARITGRWPKAIPLLLVGLAVACMGAALNHLHSLPQGDSIEGFQGRTLDMQLTAMDYSKATPFGKKVLVKAETVGQANAPVSGGILLYFPDSIPDLRPGDRIAAVVELRELKSRYPGYLLYLRDKGIQVSGRIQLLKAIGQPQGWSAPIDQIRNALSQSLRRLMPDDLISALAAAMLLGDKSKLDTELKADFSRAGLSHVLAISGLHVGIVFGFFQLALGFLARTARGKRLQTILSLALLLLYMVLTGCSPAVCRAVLMISFYQLGRLFFLQSHSLNSLAAAALILLALDPSRMFQVGFQLSFAAVTGILVFAPRWQKAAEASWGKWGRDPLVKSAVVCLTAQVLTMPLVAWYFEQFPTYFLFANLLLLPLVAFSVNLGAVALFFSWVPGVNQALFGMLDFCLWVLTQVGNWFGTLPGAIVESISFSDAGFCILLGMGLSLLLLLKARGMLKLVRQIGKRDALSLSHPEAISKSPCPVQS